VALPPGAKVTIRDQEIIITTAIPFAHKFALQSIEPGQPVVKYGEIIGLAKAPISPGDHVHRHNLDHRVENIIISLREQP
jgi:altronate dehydratase